MTSQDALADRYGAPAPWRRSALVLASILLAVVFLGWLGWTVWSHSTPAVDSELVSYQVVDEHTARAVVDVRLRNDDVDATCLLRAFSEDHTTVGELSFVPEPGDTERSEESVRTERRATSVELIGCTAPGQNRPR